MSTLQHCKLLAKNAFKPYWLDKSKGKYHVVLRRVNDHHDDDVHIVCLNVSYLKRMQNKKCFIVERCSNKQCKKRCNCFSARYITFRPDTTLYLCGCNTSSITVLEHMFKRAGVIDR